MHRLLIAITSLFITHVAIAGGGDLSYVGLRTDKRYGFELGAFVIEDKSNQVIPVTIFPYKTHFVSGDPAPEPIAGCVVLITDLVPSALVCSATASNSDFRRVIYTFSGKQYLGEGTQFSCVYRCGKNIPQQFKLVESGTGED